MRSIDEAQQGCPGSGKHVLQKIAATPENTGSVAGGETQRGPTRSSSTLHTSERKRSLTPLRQVYDSV